MSNFPDELWATIEEVQTLYKINGDRNLYKQQRYIHESRVPISCGGTMEENDANAIARADYPYEEKRYRDQDVTA